MRAVVVTLTVLLLSGCGARTAPPPVTEASEDLVPVVVYDFTGDDRQLLLSSHTVRVPRSADDDALLAVRALMDVPPAKGQESLWQGICRPGAGVLAVEPTPRNITVRLRDFGRNESGDATCDLSQEGWDAQRQQVAWTVRTATGSTLPVRVVMDDGYEKWPGMRAQERFLDPAGTVTR